jgi:F-type H+-transporting ATPase subunit gamma
MPGNLKEVRNRIKSVSNTQQITKAMKMVSAAKLRKATERIIQMRPYSNKLREMMSNIVSGADVKISLAEEREIKKVLIVVMTSDRGLCGAFNANLIKLAKRTIQEKFSRQAQSGNVTVMTIGKKGNDHFKRLPFAVNSEFTGLFTRLNFEESAKATDWILNEFTLGHFDAVDLIYSQFKNAATQVLTDETFLPIPKSIGMDSVSNTKTKKADFIFEPHKDEIIQYLIPKILKTQFFKALLDTNASAHGASMTAMDKASENAKEFLKALNISYNRARQAAITTELTEIVSGAAALSAD